MPCKLCATKPICHFWYFVDYPGIKRKSDTSVKDRVPETGKGGQKKLVQINPNISSLGSSKKTSPAASEKGDEFKSECNWRDWAKGSPHQSGLPFQSSKVVAVPCMVLRYPVMNHFLSLFPPQPKSKRMAATERHREVLKQARHQLEANLHSVSFDSFVEKLKYQSLRVHFIFIKFIAEFWWVWGSPRKQSVAG